MTFVYQRIVRFQDTDAAGVVYFANVLAICHEAYEASLAARKIDLRQFFRGVQGTVPITHASVDFFQPLHCGDRLSIHLIPAQNSAHSFTITYTLFLEAEPSKPVSTAQTRHVCIDPLTRKRQALPSALTDWLAHWSDGLAPDSAPDSATAPD